MRSLILLPLLLAFGAPSMPGSEAPVPASQSQASAAAPDHDPYVRLMEQAWQHARAHGATTRPVLSPSDTTVMNGTVSIPALHAHGFQIVPWNPNDPETIRATIRLGVDGLISDRPDILQTVLAEERARPNLSADERARLASFDVSAHRGGRGLRP